MSVKITDNTPRVMARTKSNSSLFLRLMADEIVRTARPNTPKKTGELRSLVKKQVLGLKGTIQWRRRYAAVQEAGRRRGSAPFTNYTTAGTGPHFAENAVRSGVDKTEAIAKRAFR